MDQYWAIPWGCLVLISVFIPLMALLATSLLGPSIGIALNRIGLFFQLMAGLSVLPEIIGEPRLRRWDQAVLDSDSNLKTIWKKLSWENLVKRSATAEYTLSDFSTAEVVFLFAGWAIYYALPALLLLYCFVTFGLSPPWVLLSLPFIFLCHIPLSMIVALCSWLRFGHQKRLSLLINLFCQVSFWGTLQLSKGVSYLLLLVARVVAHIAVAWSGHPASFRRLLTRVTFPLLVLGTVLELVSTYLL